MNAVQLPSSGWDGYICQQLCGGTAVIIIHSRYKSSLSVNKIIPDVVD